MKNINGNEITPEMLDGLHQSMPYLSKETFVKWINTGFIRRIKPCLIQSRDLDKKIET